MSSHVNELDEASSISLVNMDYDCLNQSLGSTLHVAF